ncbi:hypothetical protein DBR41_21135 [Pseudomonas sp. HMWF010]|nr:hypothetical protein DBR41_21135 [Pseudomonas sp. HMWF010]
MERRGRLPFKRPTQGVWADFSSIAALKTALALALAEQGASQEKAALFVSIAFNGALEQLLSVSRSDPFYFGFMTVGSEPYGDAAREFGQARSMEAVAGSWREIGQSMKRRAEQVRPSGEVVFGSVLIDATLVLKHFRARAKQAGLLKLVEDEFAASLVQLRELEE